MTLFNNPSQTVRRRTLRSQRPPAERLLWTKLHSKQIEGFKFRCQHGIGPYFVDFYCVEVKVAVEIDGVSHDSEAAEIRDRKRGQYMESMGIVTIRFLNQEVMDSVDSVAEKIGVVLLERQKEFRSPTSPNPSTS